MDINWFEKNYIESKSEIIKLINDAVKNYPITEEQIETACKEFRKLSKDIVGKDEFLWSHLIIITYFANVGVNVKNSKRLFEKYIQHGATDI